MAFNSILKQPIGWFDLETSSSGYLITRLARDAPLVKAVNDLLVFDSFIILTPVRSRLATFFFFFKASGLRIGHVVSAFVTMVSGLSIAMYFGWKLGLLLLLGVPFIAGAAYHQNKILKKNQLRDCRLMEMAGRVRFVIILLIMVLVQISTYGM